MTIDDLKILKDSLTAQTEREALSGLLNNLFNGTKEVSGADIDVKEIKTTDERESFYEKMNDNFHAYSQLENLIYISPVMERNMRVDMIKKNMEMIIDFITPKE